MAEHVILVDENDNEIGIKNKIQAHIDGDLHRAFSIFIFNYDNKMLIHKRAISKYHSGGLWTNTCCSHPRQEESIEEAVHRRLKEEMGFDCQMNEIFSFVYSKDLDKNLTEKEYDHVFIGKFNGDPSPDPHEVAEYTWVELEDLLSDIRANPRKYTYWFRLSVERVIEHMDIDME